MTSFLPIVMVGALCQLIFIVIAADGSISYDQLFYEVELFYGVEIEV